MVQNGAKKCDKYGITDVDIFGRRNDLGMRMN